MNAQTYARSHRDRVNLVIHLIAVPLFWLATLTAVTFLALSMWDLMALSLAALAVSMGFQGLGHKREEHPPEPFSGPLDFISRIFVEQFYRFPLFLLSGRWWQNLRQT